MTRATGQAAAPAGWFPWGGGVLLVALAVRASYLYEIQDTEILALLAGDAKAYHEWGVRIAGGDWLGHEVFFQAPLYPYFLGLVYQLAGPSTASG